MQTTQLSRQSPPLERRDTCEHTEREFLYTSADFARVRKLIRERAGIALNDSKENLVYSRLSRRLRVTGAATFTTYLDALEVDGASGEWQEFVNALTTNLTSFFREAHHFEYLAAYLREHAHDASLTIWCTAASTGEEPYSIAMTVRDVLGGEAKRVRIVATDIDTRVLDKARAGVYPADAVAKMETSLKQRHLLRGQGRNEGQVRVRDELREMIEFKRLNLLDDVWHVPDAVDVIMCRNVLIYFDRPTQQRVILRFAERLKFPGLMLLGHSESVGEARTLFGVAGRTAFRLDAPSSAKGAHAIARKVA